MRLDRDPVVVGRGEGQLVALEPGQHAGQDRAGLVAGGREGRLVERLAEDLLLDPGRRPLAGRLDGRELVGVDALDVRSRTGRTGGGASRPRRARGRSARRPAALLTRSVSSRAGTVVAPSVSILPGHPVGDPDLEVRGGQLQAAVLGLEQDVRQNRQGAPVRDGPADDRQAAREVLLHDRKLHVGLTPDDGAGSVRGGPESGAIAAGRGVVGIFSLSSHSVITVIMVWTPWTARARPCGRRRWTSQLPRWTARRATVPAWWTDGGRRRPRRAVPGTAGLDRPRRGPPAVDAGERPTVHTGVPLSTDSGRLSTRRRGRTGSRTRRVAARGSPGVRRPTRPARRGQSA